MASMAAWLAARQQTASAHSNHERDKLLRALFGGIGSYDIRCQCQSYLVFCSFDTSLGHAAAKAKKEENVVQIHNLSAKPSVAAGDLTA